MTDHQHDRDDAAARAEVAALRALLAGEGLADAADGSDAADRRTEPEDAAAVARILARAAADPVDPDADPAPRAATDPGSHPAPVVPLRRRAARRWFVAAGAAAAAVAAVVVGLGVLPGDEPPAAVATGSPPMLAYPLAPDHLAAGEGEPARATLLELARTAAAQTDPEPAGDVQHVLSQNWWTSTTVTADGSTTTIDPTVLETWLSPDGSYAAAEWRGAPLGEDGRLEPVDTAPGSAAVDRLPAGTFDAGLVDALPTDPAALRDRLLEPYAGLGCVPGTDPSVEAWCVYTAITDLALRYVLPSDVEAAVWTLLAEEPGVTVAGTVVDRAGQEAVALSVPAGPADLDPVVRVLLVDRDTGRLSGREEVTLSSEVLGLTEPTVTLFEYVIASDRVASVGGVARG